MITQNICCLVISQSIKNLSALCAKAPREVLYSLQYEQNMCIFLAQDSSASAPAVF